MRVNESGHARHCDECLQYFESLKRTLELCGRYAAFFCVVSRMVTLAAAFICLRYHYTCHLLLLVHQNMSVAPRSVVNKHAVHAFIEAIMCGLFVLPFNQYELLVFEGSHEKRVFYRVEYAIALLSFLKLLYPLRVLIDNVLDKFNNSLVLRKLAYFNPNTTFAVKIIIRNNPILFAATSWCLLLCASAYVLRIAEAPANANSMEYTQMLYMSVVTAWTLGYGDVVPKTYIGRTMMAFTIGISCFLIPVSIVFLGSFLDLKSSERHIVKIYTHAQMMKTLENTAASFLTKWLRLMIQKKQRRGKWSVELHWMVLELVSSHATQKHYSKTKKEPPKNHFKTNTGWYMEKNTQHTNVGTCAASKS